MKLLLAALIIWLLAKGELHTYLAFATTQGTSS